MGWQQGGRCLNTWFDGIRARCSKRETRWVLKSSVRATAEGQGLVQISTSVVLAQTAGRKGRLVGHLPSATQIPELGVSRRKKALKKKTL